MQVNWNQGAVALPGYHFTAGGNIATDRSHHADDESQRRTAARLAQPYLSIDGEGIKSAQGTPQPYVLLTASNGHSIYNPEGLRTNDVFEFLLGLGVKELWAFMGTYDINMWLAGLSREHLDRLASEKARHSCKWGDYQITHIMGKMFRLKRKDGPPGIVVWDMFPYVQMSFLKYITDWNLIQANEQDAVQVIKTMKENRAEFTLDQIEQIKRYNLLETVILQRGVDKLKSLASDPAVNITPTLWYSPGSFAAKAMKMHGIDEHTGKGGWIAKDIQDAAQAAYYGGRFETTLIGQIKGPLYEYDINSAYPAACVNLPSLKGGGSWQWEANPDLDNPDLIALVKVSWETDKGVAFGPFPVRLPVGSLRYPLYSRQAGWYWSVEVAAARNITHLTVHGAWVLYPATYDKPFAWIASMYAQRAIWKTQHDAREKVLKLTMNSIYGKMAQTPHNGFDPRYRQPIWAGLITATTRAKLLQAIAQGSVLFTATDGLVSKHKLYLPIGVGLGQWEEKELEWVFSVQSGIYFSKVAGEALKIRTRGVGRTTLDYDNLYAAFSRGDETYKTVQHKFMGYRSALRQGIEQWRTWSDQVKVLSLTLQPRRERERRRGGVLYSYPPLYADVDSSDQLVNDVYELAGMYAWERDLTMEQPDGEDVDV